VKYQCLYCGKFSDEPIELNAHEPTCETITEDKWQQKLRDTFPNIKHEYQAVDYINWVRRNPPPEVTALYRSLKIYDEDGIDLSLRNAMVAFERKLGVKA